MKSRHFRSGVAINSICLLLLLSVYLTSTVVQSAADPYSLKNWLEFTEKQWPYADKPSTAPFLVFHSEFVNGNVLGLKKSIFNVTENWLTNPDLFFRYWASEQTYFRSRKSSQTQPKIDLKLVGGSSDWKSTTELEINSKTSLKSISKERWEEFGFENSDIFTLGLKDVSIKFVEKIDLSKTAQITAYPTAVEGFKSVNFSDPQPALSNGGGAVNINEPTLDNDGKIMKFPVGKTVKLNVEKLNYKVIKFECNLNGQSKLVTIKSLNGNCDVDNMKELFKNSKCKKVGTNEVIEILQAEASPKQYSITKFEATTNNNVVKKSLKTDLLPLNPPVNPPNNEKTVIYKIDPKIISLTKYTQIKGYVRFNGTKATGNDANKDICYTISKTDTIQKDVSSVDVYLTLEGAQAGFKLDTINNNKPVGKTICLFDYVALKNIDNYIITLVVQGEITAGFSISVTTRFDKIADKKLAAPEGANILASPQWFYYNSIFDNVLKTDDKKAELYACDVISSCYPFKLNDDDQTKFEWFLPAELKNELKKSPFFQIRGSVKSGKVSFVKTPNTKSQEMFNKDFIKDNEQFLIEKSITDAKAKPADANSYYLKFNSNDNTSVITLSLDSIDMRFQKLIIKIDLVNKADDKPIKRTDDPKSELLLSSVTLKNAENNELPLSPESIVPTAKIVFDTFKISSADLFYVKPTQIVTGNKITLTLQLNADVPAKPMPFVKVQFTVDSLSTTDQTSPLSKKATKTDLKMLPKSSNKIEKSEFKLIFTDFIDNADTTLLGKIALNFGLTISSSPEVQIKPENYLVFRSIINQDLTIKYKRVFGTVDEQHKNIITFSDANKDSDDTPVKGVFRVVYFIHSLLQNSGKVDVDIKSFSLEGKATTDKENSKVTQSLAHVNLEYEKAVCVYGNTTTNNVCQLPNFNQITEIKCDMAAGCSNIFDRQLPTSTQIGPVGDLKRRFAPFQLENSKTKKHQLEINRKFTPATPTPDFCVDFYYLAKTTSLRVASDADTKNIIELPLTPSTKNNDYTTKICASHFTNDVGTVNKLIFYFDNHQELDIDNHYVEFKKDQIDNQNSPPNTNLVLDTGIYISNLDKNQFFDFNHWTATNDKKLFNNLLVYKINAVDLKTRFAGKGANSKDGSTELYYETLRTRWIKMPVENAGLKFGLKFNKSNEDVITSSIVVDSKTTVHLISSKRTKNSFPLNKFNNDALTVIEKSLPDEHFMLEIVVTLNMTKISELNVAKKLVSDLVIEIENFNINDPCIVGDSLSKLEKCNSDEGTQDKFHNWCERGYNETNFGPNCHCTDAFTGTGCLDENYCKTQGYTLCRSADKCHNDEDFKQVKCDCNKGEKWNPFLKGCINPAELTKCGENRRPQYTSVPRKIQCVCIEDYIEVSLNATTKACVPFEPCNKEHRKNLSIKIPCPNANTTCQPTGSKTQPGDFQCNCNTGFININEVRTSEAKCLPEVCAKCLGSCKQTGKIYNCDQTFCDLTGYDFNSTTKECKFNGDKFAKLLGCDKQGLTAILGNDKKPACKCVEGQKLDLLSRLCLTECDETATNACKERGASTCKFENGKAQCKCSSTELPYAKANASDWKCISKCSLLEMPDFYEARCGNSFEHCIENGNLPIKPLEDAANSPYITGVFISNITKINIDEAVKNGIDKQKEYCACDLGFIWEPTAKKCFPSTIPTHTISGFEFDLIPTHDLKKYIEDVENAFTNLVAAVIGLDKKKKPNIFKNLKRATKCEKADEKSILCRTSFQSTMTNEQITKKLASACVPAETDKSKCFYVVNPTNTFLSNFITKSAIDDTNFITYGSHTNSFSQDNNVLVHNPSINPKVTKEEYCSKNKNTCSSYAYSVCKDDETKPFECLCPVKEKPFFKIIDSKKLSLTENGKTIDLRMETCGIHNMCKVDKNNFGCKSDDALCHFQVELDDVKKEYFGVSYCTCPTGATLSDRSLSCKESCNGFCSNNTASCGQDYLNTKKIICNCKDGFTGSKCEKKATEAKKEAEVSSSKAYLISTIVVSVIAAIALIGLAVLYFKRR